MVTTLNWRPITEAPKDITNLFLFSTDFIDEDFNPSGIVDGFWNDDFGWTVWRWNGCQDMYDTVHFQEPSHFAIKERPGG